MKTPVIIGISIGGAALLGLVLFLALKPKAAAAKKSAPAPPKPAPPKPAPAPVKQKANATTILGDVTKGVTAAEKIFSMFADGSEHTSMNWNS